MCCSSSTFNSATERSASSSIAATTPQLSQRHSHNNTHSTRRTHRSFKTCWTSRFKHCRRTSKNRASDGQHISFLCRRPRSRWSIMLRPPRPLLRLRRPFRWFFSYSLPAPSFAPSTLATGRSRASHASETFRVLTQRTCTAESDPVHSGRSHARFTRHTPLVVAGVHLSPRMGCAASTGVARAVAGDHTTTLQAGVTNAAYAVVHEMEAHTNGHANDVAAHRAPSKHIDLHMPTASELVSGTLLLLSTAARAVPLPGADAVASILATLYTIFNAAANKTLWMAEFMVRDIDRQRTHQERHELTSSNDAATCSILRTPFIRRVLLVWFFVHSCICA
jgi:hypothetical protein